MKVQLRDIKGGNQGELEVKFVVIENRKYTQTVHDSVVAHRAAQRIEHAARGVVDDRGVELVAVAQRLAVQQQPLRILQQTVVVGQIVEILGAVEEFVGLHILRDRQRDRAEGGDDLSRSGLHDSCPFLGNAKIT